jgi:hypothetical protein
MPKRDVVAPFHKAVNFLRARLSPLPVIVIAEETPMQVRTFVFGSIIAAGLVAGGLTIAQPARDVNPNKHPNLAAAQRLTAQAYQKITDAQQANEWDMQGHAAHAKQLLDQANNELKQAAEAANRAH